MPATARRRALVLAAALLALTVAPGCAHAATTCDVVASPTGSDANAGTADAPLRTPQAVVDRLTAGQTGCLRAGTYSTPSGKQYVARMPRAGAAGAPITLRSYPGERAALHGILEIPHGSDFVTISDLDLVGDPSDSVPTTLGVFSSDVVLQRLDVSNAHVGTCVMLGSTSGWGRAVRTTIVDDVIHDCGSPANGMLDHAIYAEATNDVHITENLFYNTQAFAIQLYPDAQGTEIDHNVMNGNGGGVIFAGEGSAASSGNVVENNVIANSLRDYDVTQYWGSAVGTGNVARSNCLFNGHGGDVTPYVRGFSTSGNVSADPQFVAAASNDLRLKAGSPCLAVLGYDVAAKVLGVAADAAAGAVSTTVAPVATSASPPAAPVNAAPTVSFAAPAAGATVFNTLSVTAGAQDDQGVVRVELWVDGARRAYHTQAPWTFDVNARSLRTGTHRLTLKAFDAQGLTGTASLSVRKGSSRLARAAAVRRARAARARKARAARARRARG